MEHGVDAVRGPGDRGRVEQVQLASGRREQLVPGGTCERTKRPAEDSAPPVTSRRIEPASFVASFVDGVGFIGQTVGRGRPNLKDRRDMSSEGPA